MGADELNVSALYQSKILKDIHLTWKSLLGDSRTKAVHTRIVTFNTHVENLLCFPALRTLRIKNHRRDGNSVIYH